MPGHPEPDPDHGSPLQTGGNGIAGHRQIRPVLEPPWARVKPVRRRWWRGGGWCSALVVVGAVGVLVAWDRRGADDRSSAPPPPPPRTSGVAAGTPNFDTARAQLAALPVRGLGPGPGFSALALRQGLERRRQRRVRPQRLQHPRRHPAPRPHRPGGAPGHLLRPERVLHDPTRGRHFIRARPRYVEQHRDRPRGVVGRRLGTRARGPGIHSADSTSPTTRATCSP